MVLLGRSCQLRQIDYGTEKRVLPTPLGPRDCWTYRWDDASSLREQYNKPETTAQQIENPDPRIALEHKRRSSRRGRKPRLPRSAVAPWSDSRSAARPALRLPGR